MRRLDDEKLRLVTSVLVLPYRNPLLAAHQLATLDALSAGRLIVGAGTGYLKSEFRALGVDPEQRTRDFDEVWTTMTAVWARAAAGGLIGAAVAATVYEITGGMDMAILERWQQRRKETGGLWPTEMLMNVTEGKDMMTPRQKAV